MNKVTANAEDVHAAIAAGFLRVCLETGVIEKTVQRGRWVVARIELVRCPTAPSPYGRVTFQAPRGSMRQLVHRVVWWAAGRVIPRGQEVNHKNGKKLECGIANLECLTRKRNIEHAIATGLFDPRSSKNGMFSAAEVQAIRRRAEHESYSAIGRAVGTDASTISKIVRRITYPTVA